MLAPLGAKVYIIMSFSSKTYGLESVVDLSFKPCPEKWVRLCEDAIIYIL
jgi:hypothetical protein